MARKTIDFGIDLGTTNSVIACMDRGELVIIRNQVTQSELTPSVVRVDARGTVIVGQAAYNELEFDSENTVAEFKRWMGNPHVDGFTFKKTGKRMTAAELSAEVLKVLRASVANRLSGEEPQAAVITVPAHFLISACEDTEAAARLAGITVGPFLQEPVAAAIAYGYKAESLSGKLLVFDLGGGTFDTTLLHAREEKMVVLGHDGDDKLGGKDFDWALVEVITQRLRQEYGDLPCQRGNPVAQRVMAVLKQRAEETKKTLSALPRVFLEVKGLPAPFAHIDTVVELTRADLERATRDFTARCLSICRRLLKDAGVASGDLTNVLVVGGQTQTPYIREAILKEFGKADCRLDPMTVVAVGAALYASSLRAPATARCPVSDGSTVLRLAYEPNAASLDADVGITLECVPTGATVAIVRSDGGWSTGAVPVPASGKLLLTVVLRPKQVNSFEVQASDARGSRIKTSEQSFSITHGIVVADATTSRGLSVALIDNGVAMLVPKGSPLPAKGVHTFVTAHEVIAGDSKSVLRTYFLEGEHPRSDRNIAIGSIELRGTDLQKNLCAGAEVEITYQLSDSKTLSAQAYFPEAQETIPMIRIYDRPRLLPAEIDVELSKEKKRLEEIKRALPEIVDPALYKDILVIELERLAAAGETDAQQKAAQRLLDLKAAIDEIEKLAAWELLVTEFEYFRQKARQVLESSGGPEQVDAVEEAIRYGESAIFRRDRDDLERRKETLKDTYWEIQFARDGFWKEQFAWLKDSHEFVDPAAAENLKERGTRALRQDDVVALRSVVWDLYGLLPTWQPERFGSYISSLIDKAESAV